MKRILIVAGVVAMVLSGNTTFAQGGGGNVLNPATSNVSLVPDGLYTKENTPSRPVVAWTFLREADVTWQKRIWRMIDLREKMNQQLYYPTARNANRQSFWDYITDAMKSEESRRLRVYAALPFDYDKTFMVELTKSEADSQLSRSITIYDSSGNAKFSSQAIESQDILQYLLKEDWYFDRQRSVMDVHILGICPFRKVFDGTGAEMPGANMMFWIYFPSLRPFLTHAEVYNPKNDAERRTFDDIFWKRQFSSFIVQESNVANRKIAEYLKNPLDALLEAESIKNDMFNLEHDMWQY